jgi:heme/copper-type cytochrome/quinol oxidase subunit 3
MHNFKLIAFLATAISIFSLWFIYYLMTAVLGIGKDDSLVIIVPSALAVAVTVIFSLFRLKKKLEDIKNGQVKPLKDYLF